MKPTIDLTPEVWIRNGHKLYMWTWLQYETMRNIQREKDATRRGEFKRTESVFTAQHSVAQPKRRHQEL